MWQGDKTSQVGVDYVGCTQFADHVQLHSNDWIEPPCKVANFTYN